MLESLVKKNVMVLALGVALAAAPVVAYASPVASEMAAVKKTAKKKSTTKKSAGQAACAGFTVADFGYNSGVKELVGFVGAGMYVSFTFSKDGKLIKATYDSNAGSGRLKKSDIKEFAEQFANNWIPNPTVERY